MNLTERKFVESWLKSHPEYAHRKHQYQIISHILGVDPEIAKAVCVLQRRIREVITNDENGKVLAAQWKVENQKDDIFDNIILVNGVKMRVV